MTFTKPMIDLIREIRKHVPVEEKPGIKLANPDVVDELIALYHTSKNTVFKVLTRELCTLAGEQYLAQLDPPTDGAEEESQVNQGKQINITRVYRGQIQIVKKSFEDIEPVMDTEMVNQSPKVYRGVVQK